jgi:Tub family
MLSGSNLYHQEEYNYDNLQKIVGNNGRTGVYDPSQKHYGTQVS